MQMTRILHKRAFNSTSGNKFLFPKQQQKKKQNKKKKNHKIKQKTKTIWPKRKRQLRDREEEKEEITTMTKLISRVDLQFFFLIIRFIKLCREIY